MRRLVAAMVILTAVGVVVSSEGAAEAVQAETSTVIGCLQEDDASEGFVLENAVDAEGSGEGAEATYRLTGVIPPGVRLADHVGHQVQVTGTVGEPPESGERPVFTLYEFEHVAAACS